MVALALQTSSGFMISGDSHILDEKNNLEKKFKRLRILSKAEFEARLPVIDRLQRRRRDLSDRPRHYASVGNDMGKGSPAPSAVQAKNTIVKPK